MRRQREASDAGGPDQSQGIFVGVQPVQPHRALTQKGPTLGLILCCHCLEIVNNF